MAVVRDLRVLLRFRNFRRLLAVRLLSQGADGVYQVALATYVVFSPEKQTSAAAIASAMAVLLLPYSLVGPFAGVLLDRWRRRQVLLYGNLLRAVLASVTAALMIADVPDWLFYVSALCVTAVNRFVLVRPVRGAAPRGRRRAAGDRQLPFPDRRNARRDRGRRPGLRRTAGGLRTPTRPWCSWAPPCTCARRWPRCACRRNCSAPTPSWCSRGLTSALSGTARDLAAGVRHLATPPRREAAWALVRDDPDALLLRRPAGHAADALPVRLVVGHR